MPSLPPATLVLIALALWAAWCLCARLIITNPLRDIRCGLLFPLILLWLRLLHRARYQGLEHIPPARPLPGPDADEHDQDQLPRDPDTPRGLIVVANHTAGIDPVLIGWVCPFHIRWMMAAAMRVRAIDAVWAWLRVIFVNTTPGHDAAADLLALKDALRHLKAGGALGIFPEGTVARPRGTLYPFQPGIGRLVAKSGARVLPVIITGTPSAPTAWGTLLRPGHAQVRFLPVIDFAGQSPEQITAHLHELFRAGTGWRDPTPAEQAANAW